MQPAVDGLGGQVAQPYGSEEGDDVPGDRPPVLVVGGGLDSSLLRRQPRLLEELTEGPATGADASRHDLALARPGGPPAGEGAELAHPPPAACRVVAGDA